jgi:hypothetical protein
VSADAVSWREKTEFWQALTTCVQQQPLSCFPTASAIADGQRLPHGPRQLLKIQLNDQERRAVGRLLTERKALLIETAEDTTQPDAARHAALIELSVLESVLEKLWLGDAAATGIDDVLQGRPSTRRSDP